MRSNVILVIIIVLIISSTGYTQDTPQNLQEIYTRLGNMENRVNTVDIKVDRNSDLIKLGFDSNVSEHTAIVGRLNGISARIGSIDTTNINVATSLATMNGKLSSNLVDYTTATRLNEVILRGEAVRTPAKTNYLGYSLVGIISGLLAGGMVLIGNLFLRRKDNVEHT